MFFKNGDYEGKQYVLETYYSIMEQNLDRNTLFSATDIQMVTARYADTKEEIGSKPLDLEHSNLFDERSIRIWKSYQATREGDYSLRSGFHNYGCYDAEVYQPLTSRQESLSEHSLGTMTLLRLLSDFYPEIISGELLLRCLDFMRYHDLGETEYGDIPDNGRRDSRLADAREFFSLARKLAFLPEYRRDQILRDFEIFNQSPDQLNGIDQVFQSLCKLTDKSDAILRGLIYENKGHRGNLRHVPREIKTTGEQYYANIMQDSSLVAVFTASFIDKHHRSFFFPVFFDILRASIIITRTEWFRNWGQVIKKLGVPEERFDLKNFLSGYTQE